MLSRMNDADEFQPWWIWFDLHEWEFSTWNCRTRASGQPAGRSLQFKIILNYSTVQFDGPMGAKKNRMTLKLIGSIGFVDESAFCWCPKHLWSLSLKSTRARAPTVIMAAIWPNRIRRRNTTTTKKTQRGAEKTFLCHTLCGGNGEMSCVYTTTFIVVSFAMKPV